MTRGHRTRLALLIALAALIAAAFTCAAASKERRLYSVGRLETGVLETINALRVERGLRPLRLSPALSAAAEEHSREMALDGYFAHESRDGSSYVARVRRHYEPRGRPWEVGENLLWASPWVGVREALRMWLVSPRHRAVLLYRGWREIGISVIHATTAPGYFGGLEVTILTADFGVRG